MIALVIGLEQEKKRKRCVVNVNGPGTFHSIDELMIYSILDH
jgi:hypothetical protein